MNLEIQGHTITLGPKALAFIETAYRAKGEYLDQCAAIYCRDQLELWLAGGKCDADVTVEGPARFVAKGNAIGIPAMPKAGVAPASGASWETGSKEPLPVASAAPADSEWPKCYIDDTGSCGLIKFSANWGDGWWIKHTMAEHAGHGWWDGSYGVLERERVSTDKMVAFLRAQGHTKVADELERSTTQAQEFQVWRQEDGSLNIATETLFGSIVLASRINGQWRKEPTDGPDEYVCATRLPEPEEAREIEAAKKAGVL